MQIRSDRRPIRPRYCNCRRGTVIALALCMGALPALALGEFDFRVFPMPGGAPLAGVNGVIEDRTGAIWVVTWGEGVHCIRGTEWTSYTEKDGLPDDWGRSIAEARDGGIWVGTGEGVGYIRDGRVTAVTGRTLPLLQGSDVFCIRELADGRVVVGTRGGWIFAREPGGALPDDILLGWQTVATPEDLAGRELVDLVELAPDEWLAALAWGGIAWYRNGAWTMEPDFDDRQFHELHEYVENGVRQIWAAERDSGRIYRFEDGGWSFLEGGPPGINDLTEHAPDELIAATQTGFFVREKDGWTPFLLSPTLGSPELNCILVASNGAIWAGGREGLMRGSLRTWVRPHLAGGPDVLLARTHDDDPTLAMSFSGTVFAPEGTSWRPMFRLDPWGEEAWRLDDSIWLGDGRLWVGEQGDIRWVMLANGRLHTIYRDELNVYSLEDGQRLEQRALPPTDPVIGRFLITTAGELLYLDNDRVFRLEEGAWTPFPEYPGYVHRHAYVIREMQPGEFWAGTTGGIERWTANAVERFGAADGVSEEDSIHAIHRARSGDLWFASMGSGIYRYDGATYQRFSKEDGLRSNSVRGVFESGDGGIWIANRGTGVSVLRGDRWVHYTLEHGLPHAAALTFAETPKGVLWVGFQGHGLFRYRPDLDPPDTRIEVGPAEIDSHGIGVFSYSGRDAWNQTSFRELHYSWRILADGYEGDGGWSPYHLDTTVATQPLRPGAYGFEVRASDENGNVDPTPARVTFAVLPPLWMKPGFYIPLSLFAVIAAVAFALQWLSRRALLASEAALRAEVEVRKRAEAKLEEHSDNLEELVGERTRDLAQVQEELIRKERLATLGQLTATVSHELRNPLGTIQSSIYTIEKRTRGRGLNVESALDRTARSVKRCDRIIEELLDFTRASDIAPQTESVDPWLRDALNDIGAPDGVAMEIALNCPATVRIDRELMRRVLINLLDNAVQAMNEHPGPERRIAIRSALSGGRAEVTVEDTGPGIPPDVMERIFEPLFSTKNFGIGLGTNIMRNIMMRHHGGIEYTNCEDTRGTRVLIWLPATEGDS